MEFHLEIEATHLTKLSFTQRRDKRIPTKRRAAQLVPAYEKSIWKYDVRFYGTPARVRGQPEPPPGPLVQRLRRYGRLQCKEGWGWGDGGWGGQCFWLFCLLFYLALGFGHGNLYIISDNKVKSELPSDHASHNVMYYLVNREHAMIYDM